MDPGIKPYTEIRHQFFLVTQGNATSIQCLVSGEPQPIVSWSKLNGLLTSRHHVKGDTLEIRQVTQEDSGVYVCAGKNKFGDHSSSAVLSVEGRLKPLVRVNEPKKRLVFTGERTVFFCYVAQGIPPPVISWHTSAGYPVPKAHLKDVAGGLALKFRLVRKSQEGNYTCRALSKAGVHQVNVSLLVKGEPRVVMKPHGILWVKDGEKTTVKCFAYGHPIPLVTFISPPNSTNDAKVTERVGFYKVEFIAQQTNTGLYMCRAKNKLGVSQSQLTLKISKNDEPPKVSIQPKNITVEEGGSVEMFCEASGVPYPKLHWTKNGVRVATKPLLIIESVSKENAGDYECHVVNRMGSTYDRAILSIRVPPLLNIYPQSIVVNRGNSFTIKCQPENIASNRVITWKKQGVANFSHLSLIRSEQEIVSLAAHREDVGTYTCLVAGMKASANVTVVEPPTIFPAERTVLRVNLHSTTSLGCNVTGYPPPVISWITPYSMTGGSPFAGILESQAQVSSSGSVLMVHNISKHDQGRYICRASNTAGISEESYVVIIKELPRVIIEGETEIMTRYGSTVKLHCRGSGDPIPQLRWVKDGRDLVFNSTLVLNDVKMRDAGNYRCLGKNKYGEVMAQVTLTLKGTPSLTVHPHKLSVSLNQGAIFQCRASGFPKPRISWSKTDGPLPRHAEVTSNGTLSLKQVQHSDGGQYICRGENSQGVAEQTVEIEVLDFVPHFNGRAYQTHKRIINTLYNTRFRVWFKPERANGLIFYAGSQSKDFIVVFMRNLRVVYCFDLGSGRGCVQSLKIALNVWSSLEATRSGFNGNLRVNNEEGVAVRSGGRFTGLNLVNTWHFGGVDNFAGIVKHVGNQTGFTGCISEIVINKQRINLAASDISSSHVTACDTCIGQPCSNQGVCRPQASRQAYTCQCPPEFTGRFCEERVVRCYPGACDHGGTCRDKPRNGFTCRCTLGRYGTRCQSGYTILVPFLKKNAHLTYQFPSIHPKTLLVSVAFKVRSSYDFKLFSFQHTFQAVRKFFKIEIESSRVLLRYDLGDGEVLVASNENIVFDEWYTVYVELKGRFSSLSINGGQAHKNSSRGYQNSLNLSPTSLFTLGKTTSETRSTGFCVRSVTINSKTVNLNKDFTAHHAVSSCYNLKSPCASQPCLHSSTCTAVSSDDFKCTCMRGFTGRLCGAAVKRCGRAADCTNGGRCRKRFGKHVCMCPKHYSGPSCQTQMTLKNEALRFNESSFTVLPKTLVRIVEESNFSFEIRTFADEGLLLWHGQDPNITPDFFMLGLSKGQLQVCYELGSGTAEGKTRAKINDNRWHLVQIYRAGALLICDVDGHTSLTISAGGTNNNLDVYSTIYLGGGLDPKALSRGKYKHGFNGCIKNLHVEGKAVDTVNISLEMWNISPCRK